MSALADTFIEHHSLANYADELTSKRYVLTENRVLQLKYLKVFSDLLRNYGIVSRKTQKNAFEYDDIDLRTDFAAEYKKGDDLSIYFKRFWRLMIQLDYLFNYLYPQANSYAYDINRNDIGFLLSIRFSIDSGVAVLAKDKFKALLTRNNPDEATHRKFFQSVTAPNRIPILVPCSEGHLAGKMTSLLFVLYLLSIYSERITNEGKERASVIFENKIRVDLRTKGYSVPSDGPFKLWTSGPEYDIIALNPQKMKVLLVEVKYKDITASSLNGTLLIKNELENPKSGLLAFAKEQQDRRDFFVKNIAEFKKKLSVLDLEKYEIELWIITKYEPLIVRADDVRITNAENFLKSV